MNTSEKFSAVMAAMCKIQDLMVVEPDGTNNITKSAIAKYATLDNILKTVKPHLKEAGLVAIQDVDAKEKTSITCTTRICHAESGEWFESTSTVPIERSSPQGVGSSTTYSRRYSLCTALGIGMNNDDDGNVAEKKLTQAEEKKVAEDDLQRFKGAILPRLLKYDIMAIQQAFEVSGYISEADDPEEMLRELINQANSKEKLTAIGTQAKKLHDEISASLTLTDG